MRTKRYVPQAIAVKAFGYADIFMPVGSMMLKNNWHRWTLVQLIRLNWGFLWYKLASIELRLYGEDRYRRGSGNRLKQRYIGERKKGTLTLGWTSAMRLGGVACHGGIKTVDFSETDYPELKEKKIAFFGLSGSGKSSHTNSLTNDHTLPKGAKTTIHHDDAIVVFPQETVCYVLEPTLFDKMDQRGLDHADWKYVLSAQNCGVFMHNGKLVPVGQDLKNPNSRAMLDRDLLRYYSDSTGFPDAICWLMKDSTLPPIIRFDDLYLGLAMGATLMTKRTPAENVPISEMTKLVFEPFANPFRVYELWRDCEAFKTLIEEGAKVYAFNSGGFWGGGFDDLGRETLAPISLATSHTLHTAVLMDKLEWCPWDMLPGASLPCAESADTVKCMIPKIPVILKVSFILWMTDLNNVVITWKNPIT